VKTVLFVCTANICRSPMAEAIFNALAEDRQLHFRARSSGVAALENEPMAPNARAALEEVGVPAGDHRARQVNESMLREADLVLAMSPRHMAQLQEHYGSLSHKVHTLPRYASGVPGEDGISDPYGQAMTSYRACVHQLVGYIDSLVEALRQPLRDNSVNKLEKNGPFG
jgi:protein-tyrosine phosphatase